MSIEERPAPPADGQASLRRRILLRLALTLTIAALLSLFFSAVAYRLAFERSIQATERQIELQYRTHVLANAQDQWSRGLRDALFAYGRMGATQGIDTSWVEARKAGADTVAVANRAGDWGEVRGVLSDRLPVVVPDRPGWHLDHDSGGLYRVDVGTMPGQEGLMAVFYPIDQQWVNRHAGGYLHVAVLLEGRVIVATAPEPRLRPRANAIDLIPGDGRVLNVMVAFDDQAAAPRLRITHFALPPFSLVELALSGIILWLAIGALIWLTVGVWLREALDKVERLAYHDTLTGLANRDSLFERADQLLSERRRHDGLTAVLLLDLDRFKQLNDTFGHACGDELLAQVAGRLRGSVRELDFVARLGGDEFVVLLRGIADCHAAADIAGKILQRVAQPVSLGRGRSWQVGASVGIAVYPHDGDRIDVLMGHADAALYATKARGRNGYTFFDQAMGEQARSRTRLLRALRDAEANGELWVAYQPQVCALTGRLTGTEALLRWTHPELGSVPPDRFIALAEESGLIDRIGAFVLAAACRQMRDWLQQPPQLHPDFRMAVNVSVHQLARREFVDEIRAVLLDTGLPAGALELEITESTAMDSQNEILRALNALRDLGVSVAIDDFGTGHSSLAVLKNLPIRRLKLAREFVTHIHSDSRDRDVCAAVAAMGKNLGLVLVAEGIENARQATLHAAMGFDLFQGYFLGRPVPANEIELHSMPARASPDWIRDNETVRAAEIARIPVADGAPLSPSCFMQQAQFALPGRTAACLPSHRAR